MVVDFGGARQPMLRPWPSSRCVHLTKTFFHCTRDENWKATLRLAHGLHCLNRTALP